MKVLHVAQMIQGGPASYLQEVIPFQCEQLGQENVRVLAPADEIAFLGQIAPDIVVPLAGRDRSVVGLLKFAAQVRRTIACERPDIVHLHSSFAGAVVRLGYLLGSRSRPRIVYCAHGWAFNMQVSERKRRLYAWVERVLTRATDAIVCISDFEHREALRRGLPSSLLHTIANGIAAARPEPPADAGPWFDPDRLNLLFVGRRDRQKGFDILVDAMRYLASFPITLHVVGGAVVGRDAGQVDLPTIVEHGWQTRDAVAAFMARADVLVMPSRWEGFGLVAVEAMRQELPVCASAVDALPELVREGVSGYLFPAGDVRALADRLSTLDKSTLHAMGPGARQWFLAHFNADRMNRDLIDLYRGLVPGPVTPPPTRAPAATDPTPGEHSRPD